MASLTVVGQMEPAPSFAQSSLAPITRGNPYAVLDVACQMEPAPNFAQTSLAPIPAGGTYVPPLPLPGQNGSSGGGGAVGFPIDSG